MTERSSRVRIYPVAALGVPSSDQSTAPLIVTTSGAPTDARRRTRSRRCVCHPATSDWVSGDDKALYGPDGMKLPAHRVTSGLNA
jgi:hypothetical protein